MEKKFFDFHSQKVRNVLGIGVVALALASLSACSDDAPENNGGNDKPIADETTTEQVNIVVKSDPSLASTFRRSAPMSLAEVTIPSVPTADELAAMNVIDSNSNFYYYTGYNGTPKFYVKSGATSLSAEIKALIDGSLTELKVTPIFYIDGEVEINGTGNDLPMEIHLLPGAKFKDNSPLGINATVYLYDGGQILRAGDDGQIYFGGKLITEGNINVPTADIKVGGDLYSTGKIHGKNVTLNGGNIYAGCAVTAENTVYFTGNSNMSTGYVSAPYIQLAGTGVELNIEIRDGGYLHATEKLTINNVPETMISAEKGGAALVEAPTIWVNDIDLTNTFKDVEVKYNNRDGSVQGEWTFNETCNTKENLTYTVVDGDDCAPLKVVDPTETEEPDTTPKIEDVGSISGPDHDHPISATCIYVNNGTDAYISWHTQGNEFHGCIEHATVENNVVTLKSYLETSASNEKYGTIDFNHAIFDNGKLFVAGDHPDKGGIVGWIDCNGGTFPTTNSATLNMRPLYEYGHKTTNNAGEKVTVYSNGGSGNCIIRNGKYYQIASVAGFETFDVSSFDAYNEDGTRAKIKPVANLDSWKFNSAASKPAQPWVRDGKNTGKHIATDGENVVMLTLIDRDNTTNKATASIRVYSADDVRYENLLASYVINNAVLTPVNGKNVIAIEGNDIWVCLGKGGVKHLTMSGTSITETASFCLADYSKEELKAGKWNLTVKEAAAAAANGLAVDSKYVYVAHGGAGLIVLNKGDMSVVTKTKNYKGSANYVALANEHIYVAHGTAKVRVFKLSEK